jgi:hypothetical protein
LRDESLKNFQPSQTNSTDRSIVLAHLDLQGMQGDADTEAVLPKQIAIGFSQSINAQLD